MQEDMSRKSPSRKSTQFAKITYSARPAWGEWLANNRLPFVPTDALAVSERILRFWQDAQKLYVKDGRPLLVATRVYFALLATRGDTSSSYFSEQSYAICTN